jgi:AbrB family looped-hinge helix DNA binding protein
MEKRPMTIATITLSSKGQVVIPREIRDELRWQVGTRLTLVSDLGEESAHRVPPVRQRLGVVVPELLHQVAGDGVDLPPPR